jgi:hypothetical protein
MTIPGHRRTWGSSILSRPSGHTQPTPDGASEQPRPSGWQCRSAGKLDDAALLAAPVWDAARKHQPLTARWWLHPLVASNTAWVKFRRRRLSLKGLRRTTPAANPPGQHDDHRAFLKGQLDRLAGMKGGPGGQTEPQPPPGRKKKGRSRRPFPGGTARRTQGRQHNQAR